MCPSRNSQGQRDRRQGDSGKVQGVPSCLYHSESSGRAEEGGEGGYKQKGRRERLQGGGWVPKRVERVKGRRNKGRSGKNTVWELEEKRIGGKGRGRERKQRLSHRLRSELSACHLKTPDGNSLPSSASCLVSLFFVS